MKIEEKIDTAFGRLAKAIQRLNPIGVFGLYSGGHDSFSACYVASHHPSFSGVIHVNTGIGIEATREHVRDTCKSCKWSLLEMCAKNVKNAAGDPDPQDYDQLVVEHGFPGPFHHGKMYDRLKDRSLRMVQRVFGCRNTKTTPRRIMYVSGCRSAESKRRMANTKEVDIDGQRIWCALIHDWQKSDTSDLIEAAKAKRNPIVDLIHKSGECLCGAFAEPGELHELSLWPQTRPAYDRIMALQEKVKTAGFPWGWEDAPPKEYLEEKRGQVLMPEMKQHLCWSCNAKRT